MFFTKEGQRQLDEKKKKKSLLKGNKKLDPHSLEGVGANLEKLRIDRQSKIAMKALTSGKDIKPTQKKTYVRDVMKAVDAGLVKQSNAKVRAALKGATK